MQLCYLKKDCSHINAVHYSSSTEHAQYGTPIMLHAVSIHTVCNFCFTYMNVPSYSSIELTVLLVDGARVRDFLRDKLVPVTKKDIVETVTV